MATHVQKTIRSRVRAEYEARMAAREDALRVCARVCMRPPRARMQMGPRTLSNPAHALVVLIAGHLHEQSCAAPCAAHGAR